MAVPENYDFVYDPTLVTTNGVVGITINFDLLGTLSSSETVTIFLPKFGNSTSSISSLTMLARHPTTLAALPITGAWDKTTEKITFTATTDIDLTKAPITSNQHLYPNGISVEILVRASNGITAPPQGVRAGSTGEAEVYITTNSAAGPIVSPSTSSYPYPEVKLGVGVSEASVTSFVPAVAGAATRMAIR